MIGKTNAMGKNYDAEIAGKAEKGHTHEASDITTVLPLNLGGTGADNAADAMKNLNLEIMPLSEYEALGTKEQKLYFCWEDKA